MGFYTGLVLIIGSCLALVARNLGLAARTHVRARLETKRVIICVSTDDTTQSSIKALRSSYRLAHQVAYLTSYSANQPCLLMKNRVFSAATEISPFVIDKLQETESGMDGLTLVELQPKRYASVVLPASSHLARFINTRRAIRCLVEWGCYNAVAFYTSTHVVAIADPELFEKST